MDLFKFTVVGSIHVVDYGLVPSWGPSTLWIYLSFNLVGLVHVVDYGLDSSWGPSTSWTCLSFLLLSGPSTLWIGVLTLGGVRPLCELFILVGSVHSLDWGLDPPWGPSTFWTYLSFLTLVIGSFH